jgi:Cu+-exporting ATPase
MGASLSPALSEVKRHKPVDRRYTVCMASRELHLGIDGMTCAACVGRVEKSLRKLDVVSDVSVNLATERAQVSLREGASEDARSAIEAAIVKAGYAARWPEAHDDSPTTLARRASRNETLRTAAAITLATVVALVAMVPAFAFDGHAWLELALSSVVIFGLGAPIFRIAAERLVLRAASMETLVALGSGAAYAVSVLALVRHGAAHAHHLYFETGAVIVAFVLFGRSLEARSRYSAVGELFALTKLEPTSALRVTNGEEHEVPVASLVPGDVVRVLPFSRVPVDGEVLDDSATLDESHVTGESVPVVRMRGELVLGGSLVEGTPLLVRVRNTRAKSTLARLVELVASAQSSRAPMQKLADRVSGVFVPVVLGIAGLTFIGWLAVGSPWAHALEIAITVLVVACPCALGLATPTALLVGTTRVAREGIVLRDAAALEIAARIDTVVFDKTGTLTEGRPRVTGVWERDGGLSLAKALAEKSHHPLSRALVAHLAGSRERAAHVEALVEVPGRGVSGTSGGVAVSLGALETPYDDASFNTFVDEAGAGASSLVVVSRDGVPVSAFALRDELRESARDAALALRALGVRVVLASGDREGVVRDVATRLGIAAEDALAGQRPEDKLALVSRLVSEGRRVAMIGDGINDAPALAKATLGIAMRSGTDVAVETSAVTLMRSDPKAVVDLIRASRATYKTMRENLFWAFVYNAVGLPLAAFGLLERLGGPMLASFAMAMSSVTVVLNALRLRTRD